MHDYIIIIDEAIIGNHLSIMEYIVPLLHFNERTITPTELYNSLIIDAAVWGRLNIVKYFVSLGATDFDIPINYVKTALHRLTWGQKDDLLDVIQYLEDLKYTGV